MPEPHQLSLDDQAPDELELGNLQRLGDAPAFGYKLLELLSLSGWDVIVTKPFAGAVNERGPIDDEPIRGVLVIARKHLSPGLEPLEVKRQGETVADVAIGVFKEAMSWQKAAA